MKLVALATAACIVASLTGVADAGLRSRTESGPVARPRTHALDFGRRIDVNRVNMVVTNFGSFGFDLAVGNSGLWYPKGQTNTALFAGGLWLGTPNPPRVTVAEYSMEYGPGRIVAPGIWEDAADPDLIVYKMKRWAGDPADSVHLEHTPEEMAADPTLDLIVHHSWTEYLAGAAPRGAPVRIYRLPDASTPAPDDSVDVPGPDVAGDQMLWSVYNDADPTQHTNSAGQTAPLDVEVHQTTFAYDRPGPLGDVVFMRYRIIPRGVAGFDSLLPGIWSDPDIGGFSDDLIGSDPSRNLGFGYNATANDLQYGAMPPAIGIRLLGTPLYGCLRYMNGTDPQSAEASLNGLLGLQFDGSPIIDPVTGNETRFMFSGDPLTGVGWIDDVLADKRMLVTAPSVAPALGDTAEIVVAIVLGQGRSHLASVAKMRCNSDFAAESHASGFTVLDPSPEAPECPIATTCTRPLTFWQDACAGLGIPTDALQAIAQAADLQSTYFSWLSTYEAMCATLQSTGMDLRSQAEREYAALLANVMASRLSIRDNEDEPIVLSPLKPMSCPGIEAGNVADLVRTGQRGSSLYDVVYLDVEPNRRALEGINTGFPSWHFGGGAGPASEFFGSPLSPESTPDSFATVKIEFGPTQSAYRVLRYERQSDGFPPPQGRLFAYGGFREVPFQAWDVERNVQLEVAFVERILTDDDGTILAPEFQLATFDSTWGPDASDFGGREYLIIMRPAYSGAPDPALTVDGRLSEGSLPALYALWARLRTPGDVIDPGDVMEFRWGVPPVPGIDQLMIDLESRSLDDPDVQAAYQAIIACLEQLNGSCDDPTPVLASLVQAVARPDAVELAWYAPGMATARVQRNAGGAWSTIAELLRDGAGMMTWIDRTVVAGERYGYRLMDDEGRVAGEVFVAVPSVHRLSLAGLRPNPGPAGSLVSFSLAQRAPARLDVLDIAGRRVASRDVGALGPGVHTLHLAEIDRLPAGVYLLRLSQGVESARARMVRLP